MQKKSHQRMTDKRTDNRKNRETCSSMYITVPVSPLEWSTQRANDTYKDHLDGQLTSAEGEQTKGPRPEF